MATMAEATTATGEHLVDAAIQLATEARDRLRAAENYVDHGDSVDELNEAIAHLETASRYLGAPDEDTP